VPEAITGGRDRAEALTMAEDALATALEGYALEQRAIPTPSPPHDDHAPVIRVEVTAT
jgi:antitoxin HicB